MNIDILSKFSVVQHGDVAFMVVATVLVFFMTPGLAFFYGGLVDRKHSLTLMLQIFISIGIVSLLWVFGGFSMVFGNDIAGVIGNPLQFFAFKDIVFSTSSVYGANIPFLMFFMYQLMFAIITLPLMTGTIVNRITIGGWIALLISWMILVYFPVAHWVWGGGFLASMGFVDFAGGTVIHTTAAFSGLMAIWILGPRLIQDGKTPFNLGLVSIGAGILLFGWFGFNAGGTLIAAGTTAIAFTNTGVAAAAGMIVWTIVTVFKKKHITFLDPLVGAVAGLATITPASGYVTPLSALVIGAIAGVICYCGVEFVRSRKWDDVLDVWGVHGLGGAIGTIMIGFFANERVNAVEASGHQLGIQIFGVVLVAIYSMVVTWILVKLLDRSMKFRVTQKELEEGLDKALLQEMYETQIENN